LVKFATHLPPKQKSFAKLCTVLKVELFENAYFMRLAEASTVLKIEFLE